RCRDLIELLMANCAGGAATMKVGALVGVTQGGEAASSVLAPTRSILRSLKTALPEASVFRVTVPLKTPLPAVLVMVIGTPLVASEVPSMFCTCTTIEGYAAPATLVAAGTVAKASL